MATKPQDSKSKTTPKLKDLEVTKETAAKVKGGVTNNTAVGGTKTSLRNTDM